MAQVPRWLPLVLNAAAVVLIVVGVGSFVAGRRRAAIGQVATWGVAVALIQVIAFGFSATDTSWMIVPLVMWAGAYIWSLATGIQYLLHPDGEST